MIDGDEILRQLEEDPETRPSEEDGTVWIGQMPVVVMGNDLNGEISYKKWRYCMYVAQTISNNFI